MKKFFFFLSLSLVLVSCTPLDLTKPVTVDFTDTIDYSGQVIFTGNSGQGSFVFNVSDGQVQTKNLPDCGTYTICFSSTFEAITVLEEQNGTQNFSSKPCPGTEVLQNNYYLYTYPGD